MSNFPRITTKERHFNWRGSGPLPAWLRYRMAHRIVRGAFRDNDLPTDTYGYRANGEWQIKIFVLKNDDVAVGFCYGALAVQIRKTFWPRGVHLEVMQPETWERVQGMLVSARRAWQRRAVRKEIA